MPCYDSRNTDPNYVCEKYIERLNIATKLLCAVCKKMSYPNMTRIPGLVAWWKEHQKLDESRK